MKFVKGLRHVSYETVLFYLVRGRIRGDLVCMYKIMHGLLSFACDAVFADPPALGFAIIFSKFANSGTKPFAANIRSAFE